jgi:hypothetical protein
MLAIAPARASKILIACSDCAKVLRTEVETGPALQFDEQVATSRLLFLAEFVESGISAQRIPERIEP